MSKLEVDKIDPQSGTDLELGTSGDTITIPAGVTFDSSAATNTLPATVVTTTGTQTLTNKNIVASQLTGTITPSDSTVTLAKLTATGTQDATTFLRGDNTFDVPPLGGITQADQWRLSSPMELTTNDITANLERVDDSGFGYVGDGMTESSGVFSFPEPGIYRVDLNATFYFTSGSGNSRYIMVRTQTTTNNSSYTNVARAITNIDDFIANNISSNCSSTIYLDVTDISNVKVKFTTSSAATSGYYLDGTTADNYTTFTFTRLGDT